MDAHQVADRRLRPRRPRPFLTFVTGVLPELSTYFSESPIGEAGAEVLDQVSEQPLDDPAKE